MDAKHAFTLLLITTTVYLTTSQTAEPTTTAEVVTAEAALSGPLNEFTTTIFQKVSSSPGNVVISPFSLSTALAVLLLGARGQTQSLLESKLNLNKVALPNGQTIHQLYHDLIASRVSNDTGFSLANVALLGKSPQLREEVLKKYIADVSSLYLAEAEEVDFKEGDKVKELVNAKINNYTNGAIPTLLDNAPDPDTVFILLNAIYFRQQWLIPFDPVSTIKKAFYNNGVNAVETDFMKRNSGFFGGADVVIGGEAVQALELKYKDKKTAMVILLPDKRDGLKGILSSPSLEEDLRTVVSSTTFRSGRTNVLLPKFKFNSEHDLKPILIELGLGSLFTMGADLTGIGGDNSVFLSKVIQKAVINVDEAGTEAAAVTAVFGVSRSLSRVREFTADHPFLFLIRDMETGLIFFIGKVETF